jgi:hypothetical protein
MTRFRVYGLVSVQAIYPETYTPGVDVTGKG